MNTVALVGTLTRPPTVKFEGDGHQTTTFTRAISEPGKGEKAYTLYVGCIAYGRSAEACSLLSAEDLVAITGKLSWRKQVGKCKQEHTQLCVAVREITTLVPTDHLTGTP